MAAKRSTAETYGHFGSVEALPESPLYSELAHGVSTDPDLLARLDGLPRPKRQPNLLFATVLYLFGVPEGYQEMRRWVLDHWPSVESTMLQRRTQTNEPARCAALLPVFARLTGPLALIEIGASAGLCLYPDRYRYDYDGHLVGPADSPLRIRCAVSGPAPLPERMPEVAWRGGIDLAPLDPTSADGLRWLECLVWPGGDNAGRVRRLRAAAEVAGREQTTVLTGDLFARLPDVLALLPEGVTPVVFHSAVAAYLGTDDRRRLTETMSELDVHWVSQEGVDVFPTIAARLPRQPSTTPESFVLALDGEPLAFTAPHGGWLDWL